MVEAAFYDRVQVETSTTGTGESVAVGSAVTGYLTPAEAGVQDGAVVNYVIEDGDDFEFQIGQTYSSSGPSLSRDTPSLSKISGTVGTSQIELSGSARVAIVPFAKQLDAVRYLRVWDEGPPEGWEGGGFSPDYLIALGNSETAENLGNDANSSGVIAIGPGALRDATSANTAVAIGNGALGLTASPGSHNIAIGTLSIPESTGTRNIAIGSLAGRFLTSGSYNTFIGRNVGHAITEGSNNVGVGYRCLGAAENPIGFDGNITHQWALTASDQTAVGVDALRYSNGQFNTGVGRYALETVKTGHRNVAVGGAALRDLDEWVSYSGNEITDVNISGTYSQSGTTVTVSATGVNAVVGNEVRLSFTSGAIADVTTEGIVVTVVTAPNANTFTFTSPVSQTASGNCTIDWVETNTAATVSERNTAIGHNAGGTLANGSRNVFIGADAGADSTFGGGTEFSNRLVISSQGGTVRPLIVGDFANGYVAINGINADLSYPYRVYTQAGVERFRIEDLFTRVLLDLDTADAGPVLILDRHTDSPAANDIIGNLRYYGRDSGGNEQNYADMYVTVVDPTNGSEDSRFNLRTTVNGSLSVRMYIEQGMVVGSPTGGDKGVGTINATAVYDDNAQLTCYPIEAAITGGVDLAAWDQVAPNGRHEAARRFAEERLWTLDIDQFIAHWKQHGHLPTLPSREEWQEHARDAKSLGAMVQMLWETVDVMAVHMAQLRERMQ